MKRQANQAQENAEHAEITVVAAIVIEHLAAQRRAGLQAQRRQHVGTRPAPIGRVAVLVRTRADQRMRHARRVGLEGNAAVIALVQPGQRDAGAHETRQTLEVHETHRHIARLQRARRDRRAGAVGRAVDEPPAGRAGLPLVPPASNTAPMLAAWPMQ